MPETLMYFLISLIQQSAYLELIELVLYIGGSILGAVLAVLSVVSYRKTGLKKLLYATIAFSLFCLFLIYEGLEHFFFLDNLFTDIIIPLSGSAIVFFFFLSAIKKY
jgi:hypothetical protein